MSQWRAIRCPSCGDAIGVLLPDDNNLGIRCEHKIKEWLSREVGFDKKRQKPIVEFECVTTPGCGGVLGLCHHGCRGTCVVCPLPFTPADIWPLAPYVPYATLLRRDVEAANHRRESERAAAKQHATAQQFLSKQAFAPPQGRVQIPFLGDAEPDRYAPPRRKRRRETTS
jgi:hypothetical protein